MVVFAVMSLWRQGEFSIKKILPAVSSDCPLWTMRGVGILRIKRYGEYRLSVFNGSQESLYIIHKFVTFRYDRIRELQLSVLNNTGSIDSPL
jgi:hypothetical protein